MDGAAQLGLFMNEETTTEIVLYEIARKHQTGNFLVTPYTKAEEYLHGADWLWWFVDDAGGVSYRVQAKRLFTSGRYENLFKKAKGQNDPQVQLKKLISKAAQRNHIPIYCFYNFEHPAGSFDQYEHRCRHKYRTPSYWGCSIALARDVGSVGSDDLLALRPFMLPWHLLVCGTRRKGLAQAAADAARTLAGPKFPIKDTTASKSPLRSGLDMSPQVRVVPSRVRELIEIQNARHAEGRPEIDSRARDLCEEEGVDGLTIFNDARDRG